MKEWVRYILLLYYFDFFYLFYFGFYDADCFIF
jgi:hypothetical protein